jgi:hypothetical protein
MNQRDLNAYVTAAATAQRLELDAAQLERVAQVFARTASLAQPLLDFDLPEAVEPAPVYRP